MSEQRVSIERRPLWFLAVCAFSIGLLLHGAALGQEAAENAAGDDATETKSVTGTETYKTTVTRKTEGELAPEDFRQVSTLASQILTHLGAASASLVDENWDRARSELEHAQKLSRIIRDLLPITTVTTVVTDKEGREIYRYQEQVQDDVIPLYDGMVAVDVLQAVVDEKKEQAKLKGIRLADAELIRTSALMDLGYVDRKVARALKLIENRPDEAIEQLAFAESQGIRFVVNREDDPLVKAQAAIRVAERMVREGRHEAADENLELARIHLETYRAALGEAGRDAVQQLQQEIQELAGKTDEAGSTEEIRGFWDRVTSWFTSEPGQAHVTTGQSSEKQEEGDT